MDTKEVEPEDFKLQEARRQARLLRRLVQGTMGLEAQAVPDSVLDELEAEAVASLLSGKGSKLSGE